LAIQEDASRRSDQLIKEAEANGYFLSHEQCVQEIIQDEESWSPHSTDDPTEHEPNQISSIGTSDGLPCCWFNVLQHQADFQNKRPLLQMIIEEAGHICLFLPKFHCELNPIELFWSFIKQGKPQPNPLSPSVRLQVDNHLHSQHIGKQHTFAKTFQNTKPSLRRFKKPALCRLSASTSNKSMDKYQLMIKDITVPNPYP
jgi:hypothetical protein